MNQGSTQSVAPLSNKTILLTRPAGREKHLRHLIEQAGGHVLHYPVLIIKPPSTQQIEQLNQLREQLHDYTMAIFISPTAVEQSFLYFPVLPEHLTIVSIGSKTTQALKQQNTTIDIEAPEHNTESLLQNESFETANIQDQRILIFRGNGGRALLGDNLVERGAQIQYVETYQRQLPPKTPLSKPQIESLDAITISSHEGLENLLSLVGRTEQLFEIPIIVPVPRTATLARQYGFKTIITAKNATDDAIVKALNTHF